MSKSKDAYMQSIWRKIQEEVDKEKKQKLCFKLREAQVCNCGAHVTSNPNHHSEWCAWNEMQKIFKLVPWPRS